MGPLLSGAYRLATARGERLHVLALTPGGTRPQWLRVPPSYDASQVRLQPLPAEGAHRAVAGYLREHPPALVVFALSTTHEKSRYGLSPQLDPVIDGLRCPVALLRAPEGWVFAQRAPRIFVPFWDDNNSRYALSAALAFSNEALVTAALVVSGGEDAGQRIAQEEDARAALGEWLTEDRVSMKLLRGDDEAAALRAEADQHDLILLGASRGHAFLRAIFGDPQAVILKDVARQLAERSTVPVLLVREYQGWGGSTLGRALRHGGRLLPSLDSTERLEVYRQVRRAARPSVDFFIMIGLSAAIAALGLILDSPAVIIGAMLVAPLMSAIIGMGLAIVQGDIRFLGTSAVATLRGAAMAVGVGLLIGIFKFDDESTSEMLARTAPSLLDLLVALFSGIAGAYAIGRRDVSSALPGVAIAVALVPPLATLGLLIGIEHWTAAYGALLLFITNLAAITFASAVVFAILGFRPPQAKEQHLVRLRAFQRSFIAVAILVFIVVSHLSVLTVREIATWRMEKMVQDVLTTYFEEVGYGANLVRWEVNREGSGGGDAAFHRLRRDGS